MTLFEPTYTGLLFSVAHAAKKDKVIEVVCGLEVSAKQPKWFDVMNGELSTPCADNVLSAMLARSIVALDDFLDYLAPVWSSAIVGTLDALRNSVALIRAIVSGGVVRECSSELKRLIALPANPGFCNRNASASISEVRLGFARYRAVSLSLESPHCEFFAALCAVGSRSAAIPVTLPRAVLSASAWGNNKGRSAMFACACLRHEVSICK